jgi:phenylacetyl-CoA:acceptor oxidoreductase 27-kDa subunit
LKWAMVIDLTKCVGCGACSVLCGENNDLPSVLWRRVVDCGVNGPPERQRMAVPMSCMQCSEPPCLAVCPTCATYLRADGIVDIHYDLCVGCGCCIVACPYLARSIIFRDDPDFEVLASSEKSSSRVDGPRQLGVCSKCDFCSTRIDGGLRRGLRPGLDQMATPMCVITCTAKALHFGDLDDPESEVSRLIQEKGISRLQEELRTEPSVYYIVE